MQFKDLTGEELITKIQTQYPEINGQKMFGTVFYQINSKKNKEMDLKASYKPEDNINGIFTEYHRHLNAQTKLKNQMQKKLYQNGFRGRNMINTEAAFKLHIGINNIAELDESILQGLMGLLIQESESPANNMSFFFKFIDPQDRMYERFRNTDQLTLYFDKYSSTADLIRLSQKIETYLLDKGVPQNKIARGPKDSFGFNSFVSARFDTNRLLCEYDVYKFFDLELEKFLKNHSVNSLEIPLCALEAVFNSVLLSEQIKNIHPESPGLTNKESRLVQKEFERMLANPKEYLTIIEATVESRLEKQLAAKQFDELAPSFIELLKKIEEKTHQLEQEGYSGKTIIAKTLHTTLNTAFECYKVSPKSANDYSLFDKVCTKAIEDAKLHLSEHRGWKEIFFNLAIGLATLGSAFVVNYLYTKGTHSFFKLNTDSMNLMDKVASITEKMDSKNAIK